ncbi:hypothetical protein [Paraburkholderia sp.]|uniref:hypothetical protein n=1 Tax=Paraburkholderia sp. TaxID=1926495 RepID=UPI0025F19A76|nr:hypothetical protein [Paraburkholderia sp.]
MTTKKKVFNFFRWRLSVSFSNELWYNTFADGNRYTYFFGIGKYDIRDGDFIGTVYTLHLPCVAIRTVARVKRAQAPSV